VSFCVDEEEMVLGREKERTESKQFSPARLIE
jgi:hypothetical protein